MPRRSPSTTYDVLTSAAGFPGSPQALARLLSARFGVDPAMIAHSLTRGDLVLVVEGVDAARADEVADILTRIGATPTRRATSASGTIVLDDFDEPPIPRPLPDARNTTAPMPRLRPEPEPDPEPALAPGGWGTVLGGAAPKLPTRPDPLPAEASFEISTPGADAPEDLLNLARSPVNRSTNLGLPALGRREPPASPPPPAAPITLPPRRVEPSPNRQPFTPPAPMSAPVEESPSPAPERRPPPPAPPSSTPQSPARRRRPASEPKAAAPAEAKAPAPSSKAALVAGLLVPGGGQAWLGQTHKALLVGLLAILIVPWPLAALKARDDARLPPPPDRLQGPAGLAVHGVLVVGVWGLLVVGATLLLPRLTAPGIDQAQEARAQAVQRARGEAGVVVERALYRADRERQGAEQELFGASSLRPGDPGYGLSPAERRRRAAQIVADGKGHCGRRDYIACQIAMQEAIDLDRSNKEAWSFLLFAQQKLEAEQREDRQAPAPGPGP